MNTLRPNLVERQGFEPWVLFLTIRRFSKPLPSATRSPLQITISCIVLLWTTIALLSFAFIAQTLYRGSGRCELYFRLAQLCNVCLQPVTSLTVHYPGEH